MKNINNLKRQINKENFAKLGIFTCVGFTLVQLFSMVYEGVILHSYSGNISLVLLDAINLIFYLYLVNLFIKGKDNFYQSYQALLCLIICDFIFPFIRLLFNGIFSLTLIFPSITMLLGVIYFVILLVDYKKRTKKTLLCFKIVGLVFALVSLSYAIYNLVLIADLFTFADAWAIVSLAVSIIQFIFSSIFETTIFAFYPFVLERERI